MERQLSSKENDIVSLSQKNALLESQIAELRRTSDQQSKELRELAAESHKYQSKDENTKLLLGQSNDRLHLLKEEIFQIRQDKEKLASKLDHVSYENESLRNEVFMLKKILLEVEKRELRFSTVQVGASPLGNSYLEEERFKNRNHSQFETETLLEPRKHQRGARQAWQDRASREEVSELKKVDLLREEVNIEGSYHPRNRLNSKDLDANEPNTQTFDLYSKPAGSKTAAQMNSGERIAKKTGVRVTTDANKSSQEANILTWGSGEPTKKTNNLHSNGTLLRGNQAIGISSTGHLKRHTQDQSLLNQSMDIPTVRFGSPQRATLHESIDLGARGGDNRLYELDKMIDKVITCD